MKSLFIGRLFIGCVLLLSSYAFAQDLNFQEYRKFLMQGNQANSKKMAIQTTCTTADGKTYRIGEKQYDTCLGSLKAEQDQKQLSGKSSPQGSSVGTSTTIHFGN